MSFEDPQNSREETEVRITALLMGELSPAEAEALQAELHADPELRALEARLRRAMALVSETTALPEEPAPSEPLRLSPERRERLLREFRQPVVLERPTEYVPRKRREWPWGVQVALAAMLIALIGGAVLLPLVKPEIRAAYLPSGAALALRENRAWRPQAGEIETPISSAESAPATPNEPRSLETSRLPEATQAPAAEAVASEKPQLLAGSSMGSASEEEKAGQHFYRETPQTHGGGSQGGIGGIASLRGGNVAFDQNALNALGDVRIDYGQPAQAGSGAKQNLRPGDDIEATKAAPLDELALSSERPDASRPSAATAQPALSPNAIDALLFGMNEKPAGAAPVEKTIPAAGAISGVFTDPRFQLNFQALNQKKGAKAAADSKSPPSLPVLAADDRGKSGNAFAKGYAGPREAPLEMDGDLFARAEPAAPGKDGRADGVGSLNFGAGLSNAASLGEVAPRIPGSKAQDSTPQLATDSEAAAAADPAKRDRNPDTSVLSRDKTVLGTATLRGANTYTGRTTVGGTMAQNDEKSRPPGVALATTGDPNSASSSAADRSQQLAQQQNREDAPRDGILNHDEYLGDDRRKSEAPGSQLTKNGTGHFALNGGTAFFGVKKDPGAATLRSFSTAGAAQDAITSPAAGGAAGNGFMAATENAPPVSSTPERKPGAAAASRTSPSSAPVPAPAATPAGVEGLKGKVAQVKALSTEARSFHESGQEDLSFKRAEEVLKIDPYNIGARKLEQEIDQKRLEYAKEGSNQTRSQVLRLMEKKWDMPVRRSGENPSPLVATPAPSAPVAALATPAPAATSDLALSALTAAATPPPAAKPPPAPATPQPEVQTAATAFSTFSLNVSDVSFKLAAASLEKGVLPEPAAIRSEEFVNAFDYRDPEPAAGAALAFAADRARDPFAQNRDVLRLAIRTATAGRSAGRPLNLVLLLDSSGSMERADRVQIIHEALRVLAGQLQPQDKLSVVTFARTPRLWADGVPGTQAGETLSHVSEITPEGGTNLAAALDLGYETALRHYASGSINRVVLLTDGAANLGEVDAAALEKTVEAHRLQGVALDCFGIGWEDYNDDLLEQLTRHGDGRYGFLNTPEEAAEGFAGQLAGALRVAAADVKAQVEFNPARVTAWRQVGYEKHQLTKEQFRDNTVDAAEIGAAETGNALYIVAVNPQGTGDLATVRVRYKVPGTALYREQAWPVPYTGHASALEQASPALRLASVAAAFAEQLAGTASPAEVTSDRLLGLLNGVPALYGSDPRPQKLEWMIRQAKSLSGH